MGELQAPNRSQVYSCLRRQERSTCVGAIPCNGGNGTSEPDVPSHEPSLNATLGLDYSKLARRITASSGSEEKLVGISVDRRPSSE